MTKLEILELALEGADSKLSGAAHYYEMTMTNREEAVERIRLALTAYDEIKGLIEEYKTERSC